MRPHPPRAFTLIELLVVMGVIALILGATIPAVLSLSKSDNLNAAARMVGNLMTVARTTAIETNAHVQLRIVTTDWKPTTGTDDPTAHYRKLSLWKLDADQGKFLQLSNWETLPTGIAVVSSDPASSPSASAAYRFPAADPPGTFFFNPALANTLSNQPCGAYVADLAALEFSPDGSVYYNAATVATPPSQVYLLLVDAAHLNNGAPNWAQIRATTLTGRISVVRP